ncbi:MAG TPA: alkaline phosphatase family protein [Pyrinomonadaceae bacterium]|nr:alkaline phosphatase family protein [Pyrinomonadaceae bacterium]
MKTKSGRSNLGVNNTLFQTAFIAFVLLLVLGAPVLCIAQTKRLVLIKIDGLPYSVVDRAVKERDPMTGKSKLPWIDYIYYQRGSRLANFYVRGMSLSAPSWSMLETGQHLQIKGNVEFDRYTLKTYDYLNFVPFVVLSVPGYRVDMAAVEVLDSLRTPMLVDAYPHDERYVTFSLFQRGPRFITYQNGLLNKFKRAPKDVFDEWTMGLELRNAIPEELLRELVKKLDDPKVAYLDLILTDFDHVAHHNNDHQSQLAALRQIDSLLGQVWTAIQKSPLADETAMVVVSDHGFNSDERIYSQGYNLVKLLGSPAGGGHHVITKRRLMLDYAIKGVNPFVPLITTTTRDSLYLQGRSADYPTALLDFDGNERASVHLRDSDLNLLHILLQQLQRKDLAENVRVAATDFFFRTIDRRRAAWQEELGALNEELGALRRSIQQQEKLWSEQPKKLTKEETAAGRDDQIKRIHAQLLRWQGQERAYSQYARTMASLLGLKRTGFSAGVYRIEDLIPINSMGDRNSIYELQNYVAGPAPGGLVLAADGKLDEQKSFARIDYFSLLHDVVMRNNVQPGVANRPIDMIATRLPAELIHPLIDEPEITGDVIWVYDGPDNQALILAREDSRRNLSFRYLPVSNLGQDAEGRLHFEPVPWRAGLPLHIFEDNQLNIPQADRVDWLSEWHTDVDWLRALHKTNYSNGLIGLYEELGRHAIERLSLDEPGIAAGERLMRRLLIRQRELVEADLLLVAKNHWNFDVRGFNPGGNHGSFFRISTHSTFMIAGGEKTGIPKAAVVEEPYDSLSFVPTLLALTGELRDDSSPIPVLWSKGFRHFPGRVVRELLPEPKPSPTIANTGASAAP